MKTYTVTLFKFPLVDTTEFIMYWEVEVETGEKFRYKEFSKAVEFGENHIKSDS